MGNYLSPNPKYSDKSLLKTNSQYTNMNELVDEKTSRLKSIYSDNKKSSFSKRINKDNDTGVVKLLKDKGNFSIKVRLYIYV